MLDLVKLAEATSPVLVLDRAVNGEQPMGSERGPVAQGLVEEGHGRACEDLRLTLIRQVADEALVDGLGDQAGRGESEIQQARRQRRDDGLGQHVALADVLAADQMESTIEETLVYMNYRATFSTASSTSSVAAGAGG
ncbi:hypothetical protein [Luteolibacter marinus]|uniref:hypothetical protein n=1 Tax=Luteolibacter marinus TaxID=2776705 RepID=UPI001865CBA3|nr:hypothetical protein [Luteolibacter marinus]